MRRLSPLLLVILAACDPAEVHDTDTGSGGTDTHADPASIDTDGDGLSDVVEVNETHTDPLTPNVDADADGSWTTDDCDDANPDVHPGAPEVLGNQLDDDCNPATLDIPPVDADADGYGVDGDCDDAAPDIHPGAVDPLDGVDGDCDGLDVAPLPTLGLYVSATTGSDTNPGTKEQPFQTIYRAMTESLTYGDLIFIADGLYNESLIDVDDSLLGGYSTDFASWDPTALGTIVQGDAGADAISSAETGLLWSGLDVRAGLEGFGVSITGTWGPTDPPIVLRDVDITADGGALWVDFDGTVELQHAHVTSIYGTAAEVSGFATIRDSVLTGGRYGLGVAEGEVDVLRSALDGTEAGLAVYLVMEQQPPWAYIADSTVTGDHFGADIQFRTTLIERSTIRSRGTQDFPFSAAIIGTYDLEANRCVIEGGAGTADAYGVYGDIGAVLLNSVIMADSAPEHS